MAVPLYSAGVTTNSTTGITRTPAAATTYADDYVEQGYIVVPGLLDAAECGEIIEDAARFARGEYPLQGAPADLAADASDDEALRKILAIHFPHLVSDVAMRALKHPGICDVLGEIVGAHIPHWDGSVKAMQSMLFVKPPGFPGQAWHQDERFIPTRDRSLIGVWIALDDATDENGCLRVIPGSQQPGLIYRFKAHGRPDEFDPTDEAYGFDDSTEVLVEVAAGSVIFFNGYLLHRSRKNRSDRYRRALVNHYCSGSTLLPWLKSDEPTATADYRAVVPVVGDDPYAWKGITPPFTAAFVRSHK